MGSSSLLAHLSRGKNHNPQGNVFNNVWSEYEDVILHSLVTSFGLDFLVADQNGGDVDTLRSVRDGHYKNASNREAYEARETYDGVAYHSDKRYKETIRTERTRFQDTGVMHDDAYMSNNTVAYTMAKGVSAERRANLDHVIATYEIHEDPGRVIAGLDGIDLANNPDNLRFTNEHLNKSKRDLSVDEFLKGRGKDLPDDTKQKLREEDAMLGSHTSKSWNMLTTWEITFCATLQLLLPFAALRWAFVKLLASSLYNSGMRAKPNY